MPSFRHLQQPASLRSFVSLVTLSSGIKPKIKYLSSFGILVFAVGLPFCPASQNSNKQPQNEQQQQRQRQQERQPLGLLAREIRTCSRRGRSSSDARPNGGQTFAVDSVFSKPTRHWRTRCRVCRGRSHLRCDQAHVQKHQRYRLGMLGLLFCVLKFEHIHPCISFSLVIH